LLLISSKLSLLVVAEGNSSYTKFGFAFSLQCTFADNKIDTSNEI